MIDLLQQAGVSCVILQYEADPGWMALVIWGYCQAVWTPDSDALTHVSCMFSHLGEGYVRVLEPADVEGATNQPYGGLTQEEMLAVCLSPYCCRCCFQLVCLVQKAISSDCMKQLLLSPSFLVCTF